MAIKKRLALTQKAKPKSNLKEKSITGHLKKYFAEQEEKVRQNPRRQFAFFVLGFLAAYLVLTFFITLVPEVSIKSAVGNAAQGLLGVEGINTNSVGITSCQEISWIGDTAQGNCYSFFIMNNAQLANTNAVPQADNDGRPIFSLQGKTIVISWLCTGVLEIIVLVSAIVASFGIGWRKKAVGIAGAVILGIIFNLLRSLFTEYKMGDSGV